MNKKLKKGFTLVELLAIIVILAVMLLVAVPAITGIIDKVRQDSYENQLSLIEKMAETYSLSTDLSYDENGNSYFTLGDMMNKGVSQTPVVDPRCGKNFVEETSIKVTKIDGEITFELDVIITECEIEGNAPIITDINASVDGTSITVNVVATSDESSIKEYLYSKDNGATWISGGSNSTYTFTDLLPTTEYTIKVKVKDDNYLSSTSDSITVTTEEAEYVPIIEIIDGKLENGLIPITYNGTNWEVADTTKSWYDYDSKMWANAISVTSSSRNTYTKGKVVVETDVLGYFVYIPRYKYQIFNTSTSSGGNPQTINIEFESKKADKSTGTTVGSWLTHPAFTFADEELDGIWVGKFELTGTTTEPTVKPNISSLRTVSHSGFFYTIQKISESGNIYGISTSSDAHMMKNTEWGATTYLYHSNYGKNEEISINDNSSYLTGGGAYVNNVDQSTTGNVYGIYDMNGGAWESIMGVRAKNVSSSGFTTSFYSDSANDKYYDNYASGIENRILGDATAETMKWYSDYLAFVNSTYPYLYRGGDYNGVNGVPSTSGAFAIGHDTGFAFVDHSARVVIVR